MEVIARQVNGSLHELYKPLSTPRMQILFFHGLQSGDLSDAHLRAWESGDGSCTWPQTWLVEEFPEAHVLLVSYPVSYTRNLEKRSTEYFDMDVMAEKLLSDLIEGNIGQIPNCRVILVGQGSGGLAIRQVCVQADRMGVLSETVRLRAFLDNVKGIFYYSTPHNEGPYFPKVTGVSYSPLEVYFKTLSREAALIHYDFHRLHGLYEWQIHGLGESLPTKLDLFRGASELSAQFNVVSADHFSISKPASKIDRRFYALITLLRSIQSNTKEQGAEQEVVAQNLQHIPKQILGMDVRVHAIKAKLEICKTLGLVGMGGVGKTTLAMVVFNQLEPAFEYSCFVRDVKRLRNIDMMEEIWKHLHCHGKKVGGEVHWSILKGKALLLVWDAADDSDILWVLNAIADFTSSKSRFIVTSRDTGLLRSLDDLYEVPFLDATRAKELFMSHAFPKQQIPPLTLENVMTAIVEKCDGLPLTLEVLGRYLRGRIEDTELWTQTLEAMERAEDVIALNESLWMKLRVSYDGLDEMDKQMFLDVTTFFANHWTLREAKAVWREACHNCESLRWQTLVDMSLVYAVEEDETIKVHKQLQQLGRNIASESRVWTKTMASRLFKETNKRDTEKIHALQLIRDDQESREEVHIPSTALHTLKKLRYMEVDDTVVIDGAHDDMQVPRDLLLLKCVGTQMFDPAIQTHLVVLNLNLDMDFLPCSIGQLSSLRIFILSKAKLLDTLPDEIGHLSLLEHLEFIDCPRLQNLPKTFGRLSKLDHLEFRECSLRSLPESFGRLSALSHLKFKQCRNLEFLPESCGRLSALSHLQFRDCESLHSLPESFGQLSTLSHLQFRECESLHSLPESFGQLSTLSLLEFKGCENLRYLPESFGHLSELSHLEFKECGSLESLPESFGDLSALCHLEIHRCENLRSIPDSFGHLSALSHVEFQECASLQYVPESVGKLEALKDLQLPTRRTWEETSLKAERRIWDGRRGLIGLQQTDNSVEQVLTRQDNSQEKRITGTTLPSLFESSLRLKVPGLVFGPVAIDGPKSLKAFLALGSREPPKHMILRNFPDLEELPGNIAQLRAVQHLQLEGFDSVKYLPEFLGELQGLERLTIRNCRGLVAIPKTIGHLQALRDLQIRDCESLKDLPKSLGELKGLEQLIIWNCQSLERIPETVKHLWALRQLRIQGCKTLKTLPQSLGELQGLEHLIIRNCPGLVGIPESIGNLGAPWYLQIRDCERLEIESDSLQQFEALRHVDISNCSNVSMFRKDLDGVYKILKAPTEITEDFESTQSLQEPGCHGIRVKQQLSEVVKDFTVEIEKGEEGGFLVSAEWLYNLEKHEKEVLMSVLWGTGYSEIYHTSTTIAYERLDQDNVEAGNRELYHDALSKSEKSNVSVQSSKHVEASTRTGSLLVMEQDEFNIDVSSSATFVAPRIISNPPSLRTNPVEEVARSTIMATDWKANKDFELTVLEKGKKQLEDPMEQQPTSLTSFKAGLKEKGLHSYYVSTEWLFSLKDDEKEMLKSICADTGYIETYHTISTTCYERIQDQVYNISTSNDVSNIDAGSDIRRSGAGATECKESGRSGDLLPIDLQNWNGINEANTPESVGITSATLPHPKSKVTECVPQLLTVTCTSSSGSPTVPSTSSPGSSTVPSTSSSGSPTVPSTSSPGSSTVPSTSSPGSSTVPSTSSSGSPTVPSTSSPGSSTVPSTSSSGSPTVPSTSSPGSSTVPSTSSRPLPRIKHSRKQLCGDSCVTLPTQYQDMTSRLEVEKNIQMTRYEFEGKSELRKVAVDLKAVAETVVSCCVKSDGKKVRVKFSKIRGQLSYMDETKPTIRDLALGSVRTNVDAFISDGDGYEGIDLGLDDAYNHHLRQRRVVESKSEETGRVVDVMWVALSATNPENSETGSTTLELKCHVPTRKIANEHFSLLFQDPKRPVALEGDINTEIKQNESFLDLDIRYQLELSFWEPCGKVGQPFSRIIEKRSHVDFDCVLQCKARNLSL